MLDLEQFRLLKALKDKNNAPKKKKKKHNCSANSEKKNVSKKIIEKEISVIDGKRP